MDNSRLYVVAIDGPRQNAIAKLTHEVDGLVKEQIDLVSIKHKQPRGLGSNSWKFLGNGIWRFKDKVT